MEPFGDSWHGINKFSLILYMYIFIFVNNLTVSLSQPYANDGCVLNLDQSPSAFENSICDGFLNENCSGRVFCDYLYALGIRANQTGKIFLNSEEQRKCWNKMNGSDHVSKSCGIEKLTAGGGGCSDLSTDDVEEKMKLALETVKRKCAIEGWDDQSCASCLKGWEEGKEMAISRIGDSMTKNESDICNLAMLVTMISTWIKDELWVSKVYNCLGNPQIKADSANGEFSGGVEFHYGLSILIGGAMGFLAVLILYIYICSRRSTSIAPSDKKDLKSSLSNLSSWKPVLTALSNETTILKVSIKDVHSATNNLSPSNFIGQGTTGKVYRGVLFINNQHVAIKQITDDRSADTFLRETQSITNVRHENLVALIGYCQSGSECFLIYELCPNGSLAEWLHGRDKGLSWIQRLEIAIGSARGLVFLHTYPQGCIVHRDIKPTNILLGTNFEAKLSDFGLSKVMKLEESSTSSEIRGTLGYVDPDYQNNHQVSSASDIYSFGVVLLQILSGRKVININMDKPMPLDKIAKSLIRNGGIMEFADPRLHGDYSMEAFQLIFELALSCTRARLQRPSAAHVLRKLEEALSISMRMKASPHTIPDFYHVS